MFWVSLGIPAVEGSQHAGRMVGQAGLVAVTAMPGAQQGRR